MVKGILDKGEGQDGFKPFVDLNHRYDQQTAASLLGAFLEVVNPPGIKGMHDLISGVHKWEAKVAALKSSIKKTWRIV